MQTNEMNETCAFWSQKFYPFVSKNRCELHGSHCRNGNVCSWKSVFDVFAWVSFEWFRLHFHVQLYLCCAHTIKTIWFVYYHRANKLQPNATQKWDWANEYKVERTINDKIKWFNMLLCACVCGKKKANRMMKVRNGEAAKYWKEEKKKERKDVCLEQQINDSAQNNIQTGIELFFFLHSPLFLYTRLFPIENSWNSINSDAIFLENWIRLISRCPFNLLLCPPVAHFNTKNDRWFDWLKQFYSLLICANFCPFASLSLPIHCTHQKHKHVHARSVSIAVAAVAAANFA